MADRVMIQHNKIIELEEKINLLKAEEQTMEIDKQETSTTIQDHKKPMCWQ
jgi:hypothetical protein